MKQIYVIPVLLLATFFLKAQLTYNYRLDFNLLVPTVFTSIEVTDSCFYVCGITNDTLPPFQLGSLFAKMSFEGEIISYTTLTDPNIKYSTWRNCLTPTGDGNFIVGGDIVDTVANYAGLLKYTSQGDTILTKKFISPFFQEEPFITLMNLAGNDEHGYYLICNVHNSVDKTEYYVIKTDNNGNCIWKQTYGSTQISDASYTITFIDENNIILSGIYNNTNLVTQDYIARTQLMAIDSQGTLQWEYLSPEGELWNNAFDVLPTDDGGYLVASGRGVEVGQLPGTFLQWHSYIFKLDSDRNFEWGVNIRDSLPQSTNQLTKLIEVSDNSGYVAVGKIYEPDYVKNGWDHHGLITKVSKQGDSLWTRYYQHVESVADDHIFYDAEETPDGGFVMVGQATDFQTSGELPLQRAWIVKVDQYGCLVPDCHLVSTEEPEGAPFQLKLYPNPATDYLNVYFYHPALRGEAQFELIDASGKVVLGFEGRHGDVTHMVPVGHLAAGMYWLRCWVGGSTITKKVVVGA